MFRPNPNIFGNRRENAPENKEFCKKRARKSTKIKQRRLGQKITIAVAERSRHSAHSAHSARNQLSLTMNTSKSFNELNVAGIVPANLEPCFYWSSPRVHAKGVVLCERTCFCLLSAFYNSPPLLRTLMPPSKNPSEKHFL